MFLNIMLGIFLLPFVLVIGYIVGKVTIDIVLTLFGDALSIIGYDKLRQYNMYR